ncbi:hydrogenase large subunit [Nitrospina gracilis]|uniref:hydrogenase large subunit n=1 Tax=Nitrospina gracilis TaxID=35801 RepID=UPI001F2FF180|nr:NADH-quinone oxidoreductase subunit C [Nitrospina gracilis]MCF8721273.1 Ni,Fe-hydrogenase III large subunit/Ni,Fe-hydrogenase III component G [Nitrospina gracilis Nb-211]
MNFKLSELLAKQLQGAGLVVERRKGVPPLLEVEPNQWADVAREARAVDCRLVAEWASQENDGFTVHAAFARREEGYALVAARLHHGSNFFRTLVPHYPAASRMERTIHDLFGLHARGHSDLRGWIKHEHWPEETFPLRKNFPADSKMEYRAGEFPFIPMDAEGAYAIPVGPVHAGIIEPGHFRFSAVGEQILNLEQRLGYVHKGIEKQMEGRDVASGIRLAGRISGDATVAHSWAFCLAAEQAVGVEVPRRAAHLRAVLCELERIANHVGDIGAICNDAAWSFMHMQCQRLREDCARLHHRLFGHRLLMDTVIPGGMTVDLDAKGISLLLEHTRCIAREMEELFTIYEDHPSIRERVIGSGTVSAEDARALGLVGYAARSAEQDLDARRDAVYPPYDQHPPAVQVCRGGDVSARLWIRFQEIQASARLIQQLLENLPVGPVKKEVPVPTTECWGFAAVESWRGEIAVWLRFGEEGVIDRYYVRDPSVVNWLGLELAVREVPVPDFPLNNKSFNCSYSGNDL